MKSNVKHAVLGAGGGGQVMAAHLTMNGVSVNLYEYPDFKHVVDPIVEQGGIYLTGVLGRYFARLNTVTTDMEQAISDVEVIHIVVPAFAQKKIFQLLVPRLRDNVTIVLHPGYLGSIVLGEMIKTQTSLKNVQIAEAQTMLYNSRNKDLGHAWAFGYKKSVQLSAFPARDTDKVLEKINAVLPYYKPAKNVLEAFLNNIAVVFHPAPSVLNTGLIEMTRGNFRYYWDGVTESVAGVTEAVDRERLSIVESFDLEPISSKDWLIRFYPHYGAGGNTLREVLLSCSNYQHGATPSHMKFTYISQDVPYGIMLMISAAEYLGIDTPVSKTVANLACYINHVDYWAEARTLSRLNLDTLDKERLARYLNEGRR